MAGESEASLRKWATRTEKWGASESLSPWPYVARVVLTSGSTELERATAQLLKYVETLQKPPETPQKLARLDSRITPEMGPAFAAAFSSIPTRDPPYPEQWADGLAYLDSVMRARIDFACLGYIVGKTATEAPFRARGLRPLRASCLLQMSGSGPCSLRARPCTRRRPPRGSRPDSRAIDTSEAVAQDVISRANYRVLSGEKLVVLEHPPPPISSKWDDS